MDFPNSIYMSKEQALRLEEYRASARTNHQSYGDCDSCGQPLDRDEARSGICDGCWQARDEMGDE